jgi:hypothetical protein
MQCQWEPIVWEMVPRIRGPLLLLQALGLKLVKLLLPWELPQALLRALL